MKSLYRVCFALSVFLIVFAFSLGSSYAQAPPNILYINSSGTGSAISIEVALTINGTLPAEWVGWVIDRKSVGFCDQAVEQIGDVTSFPSGAQVYLLTDNTANSEITYMYRIFAVNDAGERFYFPNNLEFNSSSFHYDYASVSGNGYVAEGTLVDLGWTIGVQICPGECWEPITSISNPPSLFHFMVGSSVPIRISGELDISVEGPFLSVVTSWSALTDCSAVESAKASWGELKAIYR